MLIDCPACARSYHVSRAEIGEEGRTVICPRCDSRWFVYSDGTTTLMPSPDDLQTTSYSARPEVRPVDDGVEIPRISMWRRMQPLFVATACLLLAVGALGARQHIVRAAPRLAGLYAKIGLPVNVRGLDIVALEPRRDAETLKVAGEIRNVAQSRVRVPRLVYEVRDAEGGSLLTWSEPAPAHTLGTGRTMSFLSSPHPLPPGSRSLVVRFEDAEVVQPLRLAHGPA